MQDDDLETSHNLEHCTELQCRAKFGTNMVLIIAIHGSMYALYIELPPSLQSSFDCCNALLGDVGISKSEGVAAALPSTL